MHQRIHRNDFGNRHPENSFAKRNKGVSNRGQLNQHRKTIAANNYKQTRPARTVDKKVQSDWKATQKRNDRKKVTEKYSPSAKKKTVEQNSNRTSWKPSSTVKKQPANKGYISYKQPEQQKKYVQQNNRKTTRKPASTVRTQATNKKQYTKKPSSQNTKQSQVKSPARNKQSQKTNKSNNWSGRK